MSRDASPSERPTDQTRRPVGRRTDAGPPETGSGWEYPVREYIAGMCLELAQMARWDQDERLAVLLETAGARAGEPRPDCSEIGSVGRVARRA